MALTLSLNAYHVTLALCGAGCVLSALNAKKSDDLQKFFVCSNGTCVAGIFTDHISHSFNSIFVAAVIQSITFGYDATAALIRAAGYTLSIEHTAFGKLVMFTTHVANLVLGGFALAACFSNSFVFDSSINTLRGSDIKLVKLYSLAIFVLALGSVLFHHMVHVTRGHRSHPKGAPTAYNKLRDAREF